MTRRTIKTAKLIPTEAILVSLVGRPSARSSQLVEEELVRCIEDESLTPYIDAVLRGDDPPDAPEGTVTQKFDCEIRRLDADSKTLYAQVYNAPWDPEDGAVVSREEYERHVDTYRTFMDADGLRWLAHRFMEVSRGIDVNHDEKPGRATVVESFIAREQWQPWDAGAWVMGVRVDDPEILTRVEKGLNEETRSDEDALTGFSIHILARREERTIVVDDDEEARAEQQVKRGILTTIAQALGLGSLVGAEDSQEPADEQRGTGTDFDKVWKKVEEGMEESKLGAVFWTLRSVIENIAYEEDMEDKPAAVARAFDAAKSQFMTLMATKRAEGSDLGLDVWDLDSGIAVEERIGRKMSKARLAKLKAAAATLMEILKESGGLEDEDERGGMGKKKKIHREVEDMTVDELRGLIQDSIKPVTDRLDTLDSRIGSVEAKRNDDGNDDGNELTADKVSEIVRGAMAPVTERLDAFDSRVKALEGTAPMPNGDGEANGSSEQRGDRPWAGIVPGW